MTDKELLQALRCCGSDGYNCRECPCFDECEADCGNRAPALAANRLEALLAENEHLREVTKMVPKWRPVSEPPKEDGRYLCSVMSLVSNGRNYADILKWDKDGFRDGHIYTDLVTHWMPLPEPPRTEVE